MLSSGNREYYFPNVVAQSKDDLRQDAVMQQMFLLVNTLLSADVETRKRRLNMRTYKVPLHSLRVAGFYTFMPLCRSFLCRPVRVFLSGWRTPYQ